MLSFQFLSLYLLSLLLEDSLNKDCSVFELVSLGCQVEFMVKSAVNFLSLTVLSEKSSKNSLSANPKNLSRHSTLASTSAFS